MSNRKLTHQLVLRYNNQIVRDHRVHGVRILPGVALIEIVYRALEKQFSNKQIILKNVLFKEPIAVSEEFDQKIVLYLEERDNFFEVLIKSQRIKESRDVGQLRSVADCLLYLEENLHVEVRADVREIQGQAISSSDMDSMYSTARKMSINHFEFMKALGTIYKTETEILMDMTVSDLAKSYLTQFYIHPAFLDAATFCTGVNEIDKPYIPMFIREFKAVKKGFDRCYVKAKLLEKNGKNQDVFVNDVDSYDIDGNLLFSMHGLTLKCIRDASLIHRLIGTETDFQDGVVDIIHPKEISVPVRNANTHVSLIDNIENHIKARISNILQKPDSEINATTNFYELGLDSTQLLSIVRDFESELSTKLYPTLLFEYSTIRDFAGYLKDHYSGYFQKTTQKLNEVKNQNTSVTPSVKRLPKPQPPLDDIAIIGLSGRYPQADSIQEFWNVIREGKNCISEVPKDHWEVDPYFNENKFNENKTYSKWGGFVRDVDKFDPQFFQISPLDAKRMDPQLRILLETAWHAAEDAGYTPESLLPEIVGVYVGVMNQDFTWVAAESYTKHDNYLSPGNYSHELANRISYIMNFRGPSLTLETACSSSLTAIHMARMAILNGECDLALAGGVNLSLHRSKYIMLSGMQILSDDGKERTFDANANGYVPGEGCGLVLLKRLSRAIEDGDHIYGVIKASAISHSGRGAGQYIPHVKSIAELMERCIQQARINPEDITYLETHGTGTSLGDPIELRGLSNAFQKYTDQKQFCALGSKANMGHLESASGICSLTKVLFNLRHKQIPLCANIEINNPAFPLEESPFFIPKETQEWQTSKKRIAGVNSFGLGGSGGFLLVEEYNTNAYPEEVNNLSQLIVLSAQTEAGLKRKAAVLQDFLGNLKSQYISPLEDYTLSNIAYTLQAGRKGMRYRLAMVVKKIEDLQIQLSDYLNHKSTLKQGDIKSNKKLLENLSSEKLEQLHQAWKSNEKLEELADIWVNGHEIEWMELHQNQNRIKKRVSLPGYSFAREYHWISELIEHQLEENQSRDLQYFTPAWDRLAYKTSENLAHETLWFFCDKQTENLSKYFQSQFNGNFHLVLNNNKDVVLNLIKQDQLPRYIVFHISEGLQEIFNFVFETMQILLKNKITKKMDCVFVYNREHENSPYARALLGFWKSLSHEHPQIQGRILGVDNRLLKSANLYSDVIAQSLTQNNIDIQYRNREFYVGRYKDFLKKENCQDANFKNQGVYIITGGAGAVGLIIAEHLAKNYKAKLIILGRSKLNGYKEMKIKELEKWGSMLIYEQCDISVKSDLEKVLVKARKLFKQINGVLHCAGVVQDSFIINKTKEQISNVFSSKIQGVINLDELTKKDKLDCFVLFSSISSIFGNTGQADYAYANGFLDDFSLRREERRINGKRYGKSVSINWPLWQDGGLGISKEKLQLMKEKLGILPITTQNALDALNHCLTTPGQVVVLKSKQKKLIELVNASNHYKEALPSKEVNGEQSSFLFEKTRQHILQLISNQLRLGMDQIDFSEDLREYGMDSIAFMSFIHHLNNFYKITLDPSVLLEHKNLDEFVRYLIEHYQNEIESVYSSVGVDSEAWVDKFIENLNQKTMISEFQLTQDQLNKIDKNINYVLKPSYFIKTIRNIVNMLLLVLSKIHIQIQINGLENLPEDGPYMICANHASALDPIVLMLSIRKQAKNGTVILAAENHFNKLSFLSACAEVVPFDRSNDPYSFAKNLKYIERCKEANKVILLFPEGTRSQNGEMQELKNGAAWFAEQAKLKIVPAYIDGTFKLMPRGAKFPAPGFVKINLGLPMEVKPEESSEKKDVTYKNFIKKLQNSIISLA